MDFFVLTKSSTFIIGPVASLLGWIMNLLFEFTGSLGIMNIGLCIILFTFIVKLIMFPLTIKQQRSSKLQAVMNPEIQAIQKKYKGKNDQASMQKQQAEMQAVYEKYGTSPTGGCLQLVIQMPILFALYRVISNVPAYVAGVRVYFDNVVVGLQAQDDFIGKITELATEKGMNPEKFDLLDPDKVVDLLYKFNFQNWQDLKEIFPSLTGVIAENSDKIIHMNQFLGINLMESPGFRLSLALAIPILAGLSQWVSTRLMSANQTIDPESPGASTMKTMNTTMPLMSAFFCLTFPAAIGIYWIASSAFQILQQLIVNAYMNKIDINEMIAKNVEKANAKRAKKGLPPTTVSKTATMSLKDIEKQSQVEASKEEEKKAKTSKLVQESTNYYNENLKNPDSLASKAAMVKKFNEKNNK